MARYVDEDGSMEEIAEVVRAGGSGGDGGSQAALA